MPSGNYGMSTGSDTRMYAPRSESNNMYGANSEDDDSYRHGIGDPESMERRRDKLEADKENAKKVKDLPHLRLETVEPKPDLPPGMEDMEESLEMSNQFEEGQQFAAMTGMPGQGGPDVSQSVGAQVNQPFGQQTIANIATGEPMADAWSSLLKEHKPWHQPQMETTPYGRSKADKITEMRSKIVGTKLGHPSEKGGLNEAPLALHRGHRQTTQPISLFPEKYQQSLGRHASRRLMGGIEMPKGMQPRPTRAERPKSAGKPTPPRIPKEPSEPSMKLASVDSLKQDVNTIRKKMDYMRFNQLRRLLRRLKNKVDDRRLKMADPGGIGEAGPGDGNMSTNPQGATESIQADMLQHENRSEGAGGSGKTFGRKGSGRVA